MGNRFILVQAYNWEVKPSGAWRIWSHYIHNRKAEKPSMLAVAQLPFFNYTIQYASQGTVPLTVAGSSHLSQDNPRQVFLQATLSSDSTFCQLVINMTIVRRVWRAGQIALLFFHHKSTHWKDASYEPEWRIFTRHWIVLWCCTFQPPELWAIKFCCLQPTRSMDFVAEAQTDEHKYCLNFIGKKTEG